MEASDAQEGAANSGRHRAPDGDAQTAFIPRITDASPDGVPGGPLDPPASLGGAAPWPTPPGPPVQVHPTFSGSPASSASPIFPTSSAAPGREGLTSAAAPSDRPRPAG